MANANALAVEHFKRAVDALGQVSRLPIRTTACKATELTVASSSMPALPPVECRQAASQSHSRRPIAAPPAKPLGLDGL